MNKEQLPNVSIVVIGHNEAPHLEKCFSAINNMEYPRNKLELIFIDSNSTDNSIDIAKRYADKCLSVKSKWPTAGEAFNMGINISSNNYIHITSGDIQLNEKYLIEAIASLEKRDDIIAVTGYFEELNNTGWNKLIGFRRLEEPLLKDHYTNTPNGGTFKKFVFYEIGGYDERIKKGQETELGIRLKAKNYKILYRHIPQGIHNFDLNNIFDLLSRFVKDGQSLAHLMLLYSIEKNNPYFKTAFNTGRKRFVNFTLMYFLAGYFLCQSKFMLSVSVVIIYLFYGIFSTLLKKNHHSYKYKLYKLTMFGGSYFTYFGMLILFVKYLILRLKGVNIITRKKGLSLVESENE
jgi:glycosyltransferase involved in cell wall biosynthesis